MCSPACVYTARPPSPPHAVMKIVVAAFVIMPLALAMIMGVFVAFKAYYGESSPGGWADFLAGMYMTLVNPTKALPFWEMYPIRIHFPLQTIVYPHYRHHHP